MLLYSVLLMQKVVLTRVRQLESPELCLNNCLGGKSLTWHANRFEKAKSSAGLAVVRCQQAEGDKKTVVKLVLETNAA